jgi:transient receptor potential cation channel subfamily M protein 2
VGQNTNDDQMLNVLFSCWKLTKPKLLISVTGGAKNFSLKPKLRDGFRKGLVKAVQSTNAWISTGGTNEGVMKHVGEAIYSAPLSPTEKFVVLGIANWCTIKSNRFLIKKDVITI